MNPEPHTLDELSRALRGVLDAPDWAELALRIEALGGHELLDRRWSEAIRELGMLSGTFDRVKYLTWSAGAPWEWTFEEFLGSHRLDGMLRWAPGGHSDELAEAQAGLCLGAAIWLQDHWLDALFFERLGQLAEVHGDPPLDGEGFVAWVEAQGMGFELDCRAGELVGDRVGELTTWFSGAGGKVSARDALRSAFGPQGALDALRLALLRRAAARSLARDTAAPLPPLPDPVRWPHLHRVVGELRQVVKDARELLGPPLELPLRTVASLSQRADPPALVWRSEVWRDPLVVPLQPVLRAPAIEDCAVGRQVQRAIEDLLTWLGGEDASAHQELEDELSIEPWQRLLGDLDELLGQEPTKLGFEVSQGVAGRSLHVLECRRGPRGGLKTRRLRLDELRQSSLQPATEAGRRALRELLAGVGENKVSYRRAQAEPQRIVRVLDHLVGAPRVFLRQGRRRPLRIERRELQVDVRSDGDRLRVEATLAGVALTPEDRRRLLDHEDASTPCGLWGEDRLTLVRIDTVQRSLLRILELRGPDHDARLIEPLLERLGALERAGPVRLSEDLAGAELPADPRLVVRLELLRPGLRLQVRGRPLVGGRIVEPGSGATVLHGVVDGQRVHVRRDLGAELVALDTLVDDLGLDERAEGDLPAWDLEDAEAAGAALLALHGRDDVHLEWTGRRARLRSGQASKLRLSFAPLGSWFGVSGDLDTDGAALPLRELLLAAEQGRRFVALADGDLVEIEEGLREVIAPLVAAVELSGGANPRIAGVHAPLLAELGDALAEVDAPPEFWGTLDRVDQAARLDPELPSELQAELRPYQLDGYRWLVRLAEWAGGAVLADDMGLGKTVQALALLLRRRHAGPALVVAPASVGFNWLAEAERFAPALNSREYRGRDRAAVLATLQPGDLLVTSWSLLARDVAELSEVRWSTVVLDEAQAIKNPSTVRHRAARDLGADFRLALTGTPVENHAGELHALMQVIVPGLLGNATTFRRRFLTGSDQQQVERRRDLGRLVAPFLLRRIKSQVAQELPERTEVELGVELSGGERALYERVRKAGLAKLQLAGREASSQQRFEALALLTRLRQAACHPRLVEPDTGLPSAKLSRLRHILADLRTEGHAALVFSQFVGDLKLVREALQADGLSLAWLDGSTPVARRRTEVERFQAGGVDAFLISLEAGGTGLNLTAADYVFHLDPWWNPAAEDQATDRSHRIGQRRPVTVYRLIARGTVEEQIVTMHARKRNLVADLLSGAGSSAPLSVDELRDLLGS